MIHQVGSLERQFCLPSVPVFSLLFSFLSLVKAFHDLNIFPLVDIYSSRRKRGEHLRLRLLLSLLPGFLASSIFRVVSLAFACIYLDIYLAFVALPMLLLNLVLYGILQRGRSHESALASPISSPEEEEAGDVVTYGWKEQVTGHPHQIDRLDSCLSSTSSTPGFISEDTSTIILNSITGLFLPSCHTHPPSLERETPGFRERRRQRLPLHLGWQRKVLFTQVFMADFFLMLLIVGIVILVQLPGHQYGPSVLSQVLQLSILVNFLELLKFQRWFLLDAALLLFLGCISLLLAWLHMHWESGEEGGLRTRIARSCLAFVLALLPLLLGLALFLSLPRTDPYLVLVDAHGPGQDRVEVALVGAQALHTPSDLTAMAARSLQARLFFKLDKKIQVGARL